MGNFDFVKQTLPALHADCASKLHVLTSDLSQANLGQLRSITER
jgi:hypothetical protein